MYVTLCILEPFNSYYKKTLKNVRITTVVLSILNLRTFSSMFKVIKQNRKKNVLHFPHLRNTKWWVIIFVIARQFVITYKNWFISKIIHFCISTFCSDYFWIRSIFKNSFHLKNLTLWCIPIRFFRTIFCQVYPRRSSWGTHIKILTVISTNNIALKWRKLHALIIFILLL
jgi:hypothetical protein